MPKIADQWLRDVLGTLYEQRTCTRAEIVKATGLNVASVSLALQFLSQCGVIVKVGELPSNGGRRTHVLKLNGEAAFFVAVDLEGTRIRFALTNLVGDVRYRWEEDIELGMKLDVSRITYGIEMVLRNLDESQLDRVIGVGLSHPGIRDAAGRITAINLEWRKLPLAEELAKSVDLPVFLEDAHRTCVLAEGWIGKAKNCRNWVFVIVGNGVGVGIYSDGRVLVGRDQMAGELGQFVIEPNATNGNDLRKAGTIESIASMPNILRQYLEKKGRRTEHLVGSRAREVFEMARKGDPDALQVTDRAAQALALGLSYLVNLLNPELIVFGGDIVYGEDILLEPIRRGIEQYTFPDFFEDLQFEMSSLGSDIRLMGAASLAFRSSLEDPVLLKKICNPVVEVLGGRARARR